MTIFEWLFLYTPLSLYINDPCFPILYPTLLFTFILYLNDPPPTPPPSSPNL